MIAGPRRTTHAELDGRGGFTIIELLMALLISSVIVAAAFAALSSQLQLYSVQTAKSGTQVTLRAAANPSPFPGIVRGVAIVGRVPKTHEHGHRLLDHQRPFMLLRQGLVEQRDGHWCSP